MWRSTTWSMKCAMCGDQNVRLERTVRRERSSIRLVQTATQTNACSSESSHASISSSHGNALRGREIAIAQVNAVASMLYSPTANQNLHWTKLELSAPYSLFAYFCGCQKHFKLQCCQVDHVVANMSIPARPHVSTEPTEPLGIFPGTRLLQ